MIEDFSHYNRMVKCLKLQRVRNSNHLQKQYNVLDINSPAIGLFLSHLTVEIQ